MDFLALGILGWVGMSGVVLYSISGKDSDQKKIEKVFRHKGYGVKEYYPSLIRTIKKDAYTEYIYNVPYGLTDDDKELEPIGKTLGKNVHIYFDGKLHIRVYEKDLPKDVPYHSTEAKKGYTFPVGLSYDGWVYHDFDKIPHMTAAGATTWGKTKFMKMMFTHLVENNPDDVRFYILDLKGGLAFHRYSKLKQVISVAEDIKTSAQALKAVKRDAEKTRAYLKSINCENVIEAGLKERTFIIIDEAGELAPDPAMSDTEKECAKECQQLLSYVARVSGQLGYKMIFSSQYPTADIMNRQIKANSSAKIAFRLETATQSGVALDMGGAEKLQYPGRAIYKTVDAHHVQTPYIDNPAIWERLKKYEVKESQHVTEREEESSVGTDCFAIGGVRLRDKKTTPNDL